MTMRSEERDIRIALILKLSAEGLTVAKIAARLNLSPSTIKIDLRQLFARLGVNNRAQAVTMAYANGMLPCPCGKQDTADVSGRAERGKGPVA